MGDRDLWGEKPGGTEKKHFRSSKDPADEFFWGRYHCTWHLSGNTVPSELGRSISSILQMWTLRCQNLGFSYLLKECSFLCIWGPLLLLDREPAVFTDDDSDETLINDLCNTHTLTSLSGCCVYILDDKSSLAFCRSNIQSSYNGWCKSHDEYWA